MSQHDYLRERWAQHAVKNNLSKYDDAQAKDASATVVDMLTEMFPEHSFEVKANLTFNQIEKYTGRDFNINYDYSRRKIAPDGGVIWMDEKYPILISEMKRQGTNEERIKEAEKHYCELRDQFVKDYGSFHMTFTDTGSFFFDPFRFTIL